MSGYRSAARVLVRCASSATKSAKAKATGKSTATKANKSTATKASKSTASKASDTKTTTSATAASKYNTAVPNEKGYFGRSVTYSDVHTAQLDPYYDLTVEMARKRLPQPKPKNYTGK